MNATFTYNFEIGKTVPNYFKHKLSLLTENHPKVSELEYLIEILPQLGEDGPWIAGGSLFRTKLDLPMTTDIDLFFKNYNQLIDYKSKLKSDYEGKKFVFVKEELRKNATNVTIKYNERTFDIQLIHRKYYDGPCKLLDEFDLNICQLAYDGKYLFVAETTIQSINDRSIMINEVVNASHTMARCMKYAKYGFNISNSEIEKFFSKITKNTETTVKVQDYADEL